jgi:hypothetical protein
MTKLFSIVPIFSFKDKEIPAHFTFDVPTDGDYYFIQDGEDVFLYIEGSVNVDTVKVDGLVIGEGDDIPTDYETQTILAASLEEELVWFIVSTKQLASVKNVTKSQNSWKKKF